MKKQKFKVGDHVRIVREFMNKEIKSYSDGKTGTILGINQNRPYPYTVCLDGGAYSTDVYEVEHIQPEKQPVIVITSDGKITTATKRLGKKVICTATARCSDDDTFDFNTGAELAFKRLREKEKPVPKETPWPKKLVCVESQVKSLTVGRIYPVLHGSRNYGEIKANFGSWGIRKYSDSDFRINNFPYDGRFIPLVED